MRNGEHRVIDAGTNPCAYCSRQQQYKYYLVEKGFVLWFCDAECQSRYQEEKATKETRELYGIVSCTSCQLLVPLHEPHRCSAEILLSAET